MEQKEFLKKLGHKLKVKRIDKDLGREELSVLADCAPSYIGALERGEINPTYFKLFKISKALNVKLDDIVDSFYENNN